MLDVTPFFFEHLHYFTLPGLIKKFQNHGWELKNHFKINYWGGTLIAVFRKGTSRSDIAPHQAYLSGLAQTFQSRMQTKHDFLRLTLESRRLTLGSGVCAYGIGNRALHLFAFANLGEQIDFFVDSAETKWGKIIPYYQKPVSSPTDLLGNPNKIHTLLVTAFGYEAQVISQIKASFKLRPDLQIVVVDPAVRFFSLEDAFT